MNINDMISPQARARVYLALGIAGLVLGAFGAGIGAFAASGFNAPLVVGAVLSAANAVYAFLAGAFNFVAKANVPTQEATPVVHLETSDASYFVNPEYSQHALTTPEGNVMLAELSEQNIRDIQDTITAVPTQDQYQPGGVALSVEDEDKDA